MQEHHLPVQRACRVVRLSRAAFYRPPMPTTRGDAAVIAALTDVVARYPRWGFWKLFDRKRVGGRRWNHKHMHRVYCALRLNLPRRTTRRVPHRVRQPLAAPPRLNQTWALDFMTETLYGVSWIGAPSTAWQFTTSSRQARSERVHRAFQSQLSD